MGGDSKSGVRHRRVIIAWWRSFGVALLLAALVAGAGACGKSDSEDAAGDAGSGGKDGAAASDSFKTGYAKAQEVMAGTADDAVLIAGGTSGLALADVPDSWTYSFFSPGDRHIYSVDVEHGTAGEPRDLGEGAADNKIVDSLDPAAIKVGAAEAVIKARESGSASGEVPKNVVVGGVFAQTPSGIDAGLEMGIWSITFATGTDLADAREFTVDMMTGEVAEVTE
jgi:hypothetical protein